MMLFLVLINLFAFNIKVSSEIGVNEVELNDYITSVIASEIPVSWSDENFLTMSILVRTFVLEKYKKNKFKSFVVRDSVLDQVYKKIEDKKVFDRIKKLVLSTKNLVLLDEKKELFKVYYHSSCGGKTELPGNIWGKDSSLNKSVVCKYCKKAPNVSWTFVISEADLDKILASYFNLINLKELKVLDYTNTKRIKNLAVSYDAGIKVLSSQKFRELLGFFNIKSTNFKIKKEKNQYFFEGRGFGHGAGLCQWGMKNLIQSGANYKTVLNFYFPKAVLGSVNYEHL